MRIVCLRHVAFEGPGAISQWAVSRGHSLKESHPAAKDPAGSAECDMLVVLGGPMGADDDDTCPWLPAERAFIAECVAGGKLVLGICLGAQLLAAALGGSVKPNPEPEIGWFPVTLAESGRSSAVFGGWPETFVVGHWHGDTFETPPGVPVAASSEACARQAFETGGGRVVGLQFHLEWTSGSLRELTDSCAGELAPGAHVQSREEMLARPDLFGPAREMLFDLLDRMEAL
jgi:GMP synthase-like glutamine amidotransferase